MKDPPPDCDEPTPAWQSQHRPVPATSSLVVSSTVDNKSDGNGISPSLYTALSLSLGRTNNRSNSNNGVSDELPFYQQTSLSTTNTNTSTNSRLYSKSSRRISSPNHTLSNHPHNRYQYYGRIVIAVMAVALAIGGIISKNATNASKGGWDFRERGLNEYPPHGHHHPHDTSPNPDTNERNLRTINDSKIKKYPNHLTTTTSTSSTTASTTTLPTNTTCPPPIPPPPPPSSWGKNLHPAVAYTIITILILLSAFFSGLTLGLMGLDVVQLEIVMSGDDAALSKAASVILPVRRKSNLLLCTLLLGNVAVNTLLGILMADFAGGTLGFVVSTALIVIFGEIIPQALCSRYALQIGKNSVPVVKVVIILLYVIAKPLAFCLDKLLGHELGTTYSKAEMNKLLEIHVKEGRFSEETGIAMAGALKYQDVAVKDVMTPLENTFMINVEDKLNFDTMSKIFKTGYSRIPIYEVDVQNVIGLLFTKDLIFIDPDDETPVKKFWEIFGRGPHLVWPDDKLGDVLRHLKKGHTHMALVRGTNTSTSDDLDPTYQLYGIVTLEDIIEEIIGEEILDETDAWVDGEHSKRVVRCDDESNDELGDDDDVNNMTTVRKGFDWARLRLLDDKIVDQNLSEEEVRAVSAHLRTNYSDAVEALSARQLPRMIAATPVVELPLAPTRELGQLLPTSSNLLYEKGVVSDICTFILGGKVTVVAGVDNFKSDVSSWTVLGTGALGGGGVEGYVPDFSAYVSGSGPCRCLRFTRKIFGAAADASVLECTVVGVVSSKRRGSGGVAKSGVSSLTAKRSASIGVGSAGVDGDYSLLLSEEMEVTTDLAKNCSTTPTINASAALTGDDTPLPSVSIHDELSAGAGDAEENVRERRTKLLEMVLLKKTAITTSTNTTSTVEHIEG